MLAPFPKDVLSLQLVFCALTLFPTALLELFDFFSKYSPLWLLLLLFERVSNPWSLRAFSTRNVALFAHTGSGALNECPASLRWGTLASVVHADSGLGTKEIWPKVYANFASFLFEIRSLILGFPGGAVVKNPPASAGDTGSSPGSGRSHMLQSN